MKKLLCDLGNSRLKLGVSDDASDGNHITGYVSQACDRNAGHADYAQLLKSVKDTAHLSDQFNTVWVSSVRDDKADVALSGAVREVFDAETHFARPQFDAFNMSSDYDAEAIGVDRFLALLGARPSQEKAHIIVDCGTAITIDFVDAQGHHHGGYIVPGIRAMQESLSAGTARLPDVSAADAGAADGVPRDTRAAIAQGCALALWHALDGMTREWRMAHDARVIATGGNAPLMIRDGWIERPYLVLEGLARYSIK